MVSFNAPSVPFLACHRGGFSDGVATLFTAVLLAVFSAPAHADLQFHWEDEFSALEQKKLVSWLTETHGALESLVGAMPFTTHVYMHRRSAREPVPWANTRRSRRQGVNFHVDPSFSLNDFLDDWTAPHEFSHLVLPYFGRENAWFAEGFASYMQYQVMHEMGVLSAEAMRKRYARNLAKAAGRYSFPTQAFATAAPKLRAERNFPTMYWGGATFFLQANSLLKQNEKPGLIAVLQEYLSCCRMQRGSMTDVLATLDRLDESSMFSKLLDRFRTVPGFPQYSGLDLGPATGEVSQR